MPQGRPPVYISALIPRIEVLEALEPRVGKLEERADGFAEFIQNFFPQKYQDWQEGLAHIVILQAQVAALQRQITEWQDYFSRGSLPSPSAYQPQFRVFPGANPNSNGST